MDALGAFGVKFSDLKSKRIEDLGLQIGNAYKEGDAQQLIGKLKEIGGKGAGALAAAFKDGLAEAFADAEALGKIIPPQTIAQIDAAGDSLTNIATKLKVIFAPAVAIGAKVLQEFTGALSAAYTVSEAFLKELPKTGFVGAAIAGQNAIDAENKRWSAEIKAAKDAAEKARTGGANGKAGGTGNANNRGSDFVSKRFDEVHDESPLSKSSFGSVSTNSLQSIGARVSFNPLQSEIQRNTQAVRENTNQIREYGKTFQRRIPEGFDGSSSDGGSRNY